jgi:capsule polysaccharide export protein KpsC/LpsZ
MPLQEKKKTVKQASEEMTAKELQQKIDAKNKMAAERCSHKINAILEEENCILLGIPFYDIEGKTKVRIEVTNR